MPVIKQMFQPKRLLKYFINGGIATICQFGFLYISVDIFHAPPLPMSVLSFILSLCVGFTLHRFITFNRRDVEKMGSQFFLVSSMAVSNLVINTLAMYVLLSIGTYYLLAQIIVTSFIVGWTFVGYNLIFRQNNSS